MGEALLRVLIGLLTLLVLLLLLILYNLFSPPTRAAASALLIPYSEVLDPVRKDGVREVLIQGRELTATLRLDYKPDQKTEWVRAYMLDDPTLIPQLAERGIRIIAKAEEEDVNPLPRLLLSWLPFLLMLGI